MNVNEKGNLGQLKVKLDLYSKGYHCFSPEDDFSPVDLICMNKTGRLVRLQIKYRSASDRKYTLTAFSVVGGKKVPVNRDLIDHWAVYLADEDKVIYLPVSHLEGKTQCTLHQNKVQDYLDDPFKNWKIG